LLSIVGCAVLIILLFWLSKFKRTWFKSKKKKESKERKSESKDKKKKGKEENKNAERIESSDSIEYNEVELKT
jgi:FtsZ-interacting cell division protein ZipA